MQNKILAIETSGLVCSLACNNKKLELVVNPSEPRHSQIILSMLDSLLAQAKLSLAELDLITADVGPGSFTGVRVGVAMANSLAFALNKPVVGYSSLEIMAYQLVDRQNVTCLAVLDARMQQFYYAILSIKGGRLHKQGTAILGDLTQLQSYLQHNKVDCVISNYAELKAELEKEHEYISSSGPSAADLLKMVLANYPDNLSSDSSKVLVPNYVRNNVLG